MSQPEAPPPTPPVSLPDGARAALAEAIRRSGGVPVLAERLGVRRQAIYQWDKVPAERVQTVSALSGIPPHELRPDIFPAPTQTAGAA